MFRVIEGGRKGARPADTWLIGMLIVTSCLFAGALAAFVGPVTTRVIPTAVQSADGP